MKLIDCFYESPHFSGKHTSYFEVYEELLNNYIDKDITLVEIGVNNGGSLFMWQQYLGKKCRIIGIDNNEKCKELEKHNFEIYIGNQADPLFWKNFFNKVGKIDILIDDGGHTNFQQAITLNSAVDNIKDSGLIIVEDLHTSYLKEYGNPSKYSFKNLMFDYVDKINHRSRSLDYKKALSMPIASINFYESIVALKIKRKTDYLSDAIVNNKKTLNIIENKFANNGQDKINDTLYRLKFLQKIPVLGKSIKFFAKKILSYLLKLRIKNENKKMKDFFN